MPKLRRLSGKEVIGILGRFGFSAVTQRGSHVKLRRFAAGAMQILTVPAHPELDLGTSAQSSGTHLVSFLKRSYDPTSINDDSAMVMKS